MGAAATRLERSTTPVKMLSHNERKSMSETLDFSRVDPDHNLLVNALASRVIDLIETRRQEFLPEPVPEVKLHDVEAIFCEKYRPLQSRPSYNWKVQDVPTLSKIVAHIRYLMDKLAFGADIALSAVIYVERLCKKGFPLQASTWRRALLACVLFSLKLWEDANCWNEDLIKYLRSFDLLELRDISVMERRGLRLINFSLYISNQECKSAIRDLAKCWLAKLDEEGQEGVASPRKVSLSSFGLRKKSKSKVSNNATEKIRSSLELILAVSPSP